MGNSFRNQPAPALYGENKTPVTEDVLEVGLLVAFAMIAFSFILIIPGIRGWEVSILLSKLLYTFVKTLQILYRHSDCLQLYVCLWHYGLERLYLLVTLVMDGIQILFESRHNTKHLLLKRLMLMLVYMLV